MFPNATRGYMPFVSNQSKGRINGKSGGVRLNDNLKLQPGKAYQVTLKDRHGFTYTYIVKADGSKSLPVLCDSKMYGRRLGPMSNSMPNMEANTKGGSPGLNHRKDKQGADRTDAAAAAANGAKRYGILTSIIRFLSSKTKTKAKSKRKPKPIQQRSKRQRTISAMSNLDPIQESPDENEERHLDEEEDDNDSYTHDTCSSTSESDSIGSGDP